MIRPLKVSTVRFRLFSLIAALLTVFGIDRGVARAETIARCGDGWLESIDGYPVLHLKGTPYEMGYQHGALLKDSVRQNMHNILEVEAEKEFKLGPLAVKPRLLMDAIPRIERPTYPINTSTS